MQIVPISVIIPVYGVSRFIERCAHSLFRQSMKSIEYIFVDDATPDNSIDLVKTILKDYPERVEQVLIIKHSKNKGLPAARNTGLDVAQGEYIYHCDSDDWIEPEMMEKMYQAAKKSNADIVYSDFFLSFEHNERYMTNPDYKTGEQLLRNGFLGGRAKYNVWNKLVKHSLYSDHNIRFPDGHPMGEDMTIIRLASYANLVKHVPEALYHYAKLNDGAYSNSFSKKKLEDIQFNVNQTVCSLQEKYGDSIKEDISLFKLSIKLPFLISNDTELYSLWQDWYPEANSYVNSNKGLPFRTRLLQIMASKGQWWYVRLYYQIVYKFIYGIIYK